MAKQSGQSETALSRREVVKTAGALAAVGAVGTDWSALAGTSLAAPRVVGANDRIRIGLIGPGGQGTAHLRNLVAMIKDKQINAEIVAISEIYEPRKARAKALTGAQIYHDYRKMLAEAKLDACWITTPEHWHAQMALDAMDAGCDLYVEKPLTRYLDEANKLYKKAKEKKAVIQMGAQACSDEIWHRAHEVIAAGEIGRPVWSQTSYCRNSKGGEWNYGIDAGASPDNLDWKAWLGPAPKIPFNKDRYFRWRKYWDYSSGITSDLFPHRISPLFIAMGLDYPTRVVCTGGIYVQYDREVPDTTHLVADFDRGHTMVVAGSTCNEYGLNDMIRGNKMNMLLGANITLQPERTWADDVEGRSISVAPRREDLRKMERNFLDCVRSRQKPYCHIDLAHKVMVTIALSEISYRENRVVGFDGEKMKMVRGATPTPSPPKV